jgi:hypothetical protein
MSEGNVNPPPGPENEEPISLISEDPIEEPVSIVPSAPVQGQPISPAGPVDDEEPISLVDSVGSAGPSKVKHGGAGAAKKKAEFSRPININGTGATRCRVFRTKMGLAAIDALDEMINHWLDSEEIEIKHVCQSVGEIQGKTLELSLLISVWY